MRYWIDFQIAERLKSKHRWGKDKWGPAKSLRRLLKIAGYCLFGVRHEFPKISGTINIGSDEFGRDVGAGLRLYMNILKHRGLEVRCIVVLGSRAKGSWTPKSDVDLLIIVGQRSRKKKSFWDHPLYLGIEPAICSDKEFLRWLRECRIIALDAMYYGVLAFDDGFWFEAGEIFTC